MLCAAALKRRHCSSCCAASGSPRPPWQKALCSRPAPALISPLVGEVAGPLFNRSSYWIHCQVSAELEQWQAADAREDGRLALLIRMSIEASVLRSEGNHSEAATEPCRCCKISSNRFRRGFRSGSCKILCDLDRESVEAAPVLQGSSTQVNHGCIGAAARGQRQTR